MRALFFALLGCTGLGPDGTDVAVETCNGQPGLCERPLNEVTFLRTHNSHASEERGYTVLSWNHYFAIPAQLEDGVRSLNVDVYPAEDGGLRACHGFCELGEQPLEDLFDEIEAFMESHPREVVLLDFQDESAEGALRDALATHPLSGRAWVQVAGTPWPTLQEMIEADERMVIFGGGHPEDPPWMLPKTQHIFSTGWSYWEPEDLDCETSGPVPEFGLYEVTHVLTNPLASPYNAEEINTEELLVAHLAQCDEEVAFVNLLSVDFYTIGEPLSVIGARNASAGPVAVSPRADGLRPRP